MKTDTIQPPDPSSIQIGGSHYKDMAIQPAEFIARNGIKFLPGCVIKRMCRYEKKGGVEDLDKAIHEIQLMKLHLQAPAPPAPAQNLKPIESMTREEVCAELDAAGYTEEKRREGFQRCREMIRDAMERPRCEHCYGSGRRSDDLVGQESHACEACMGTGMGSVFPAPVPPEGMILLPDDEKRDQWISGAMWKWKGFPCEWKHAGSPPDPSSPGAYASPSFHIAIPAQPGPVGETSAGDSSQTQTAPVETQGGAPAAFLTEPELLLLTNNHKPHRLDGWRREWLVEGKRPLIEYEAMSEGDDYYRLNEEQWAPFGPDSVCGMNEARGHWCHSRTHRPAPAKKCQCIDCGGTKWEHDPDCEYMQEIAVDEPAPPAIEPVWDEFPPGTKIRQVNASPHVREHLITGWSKTQIQWDGEWTDRNSRELDDREILRPGQSWEPCKKEGRAK